MKYTPIELNDDNVAELINLDIDPSDLEFAVVHCDLPIRATVAKNPSITAQHIAWLMTDAPEVKAGLAENPKLSQHHLEILARDSNPHVAHNAITNSNISAETLKLFVSAESEILRGAVASNISTPRDLLELLSSDERYAIREKVAKNPSTPPNVLEKISNDSFTEVRLEVAQNPHTPISVLEKFLAGDREERMHAAQNPSTPEDLLIRGIEASRKPQEDQDETWDSDILGDTDFRQWVAERKDLSPKLISMLAADLSKYVREILARNLCVPDSVLSQLALDSEEDVRTAVSSNINASAETKATAVLLGVSRGADNE